MGGRGSSSGISDKGKKYGTEYHTVYQSGNIKFIKINKGNITPPFKTMTKGRIYVTVSNQDKLKSIIYFDKHNKRYKQVDIDHPHRIDGILHSLILIKDIHTVKKAIEKLCLKKAK